LCNFTVPVQGRSGQRFFKNSKVLKDQQQLRKIRKGDILSFEKLFHRFYTGLCGYAESLVHKGEVAEEIVQDVFYNIWKNRNTLRISSSWQSYLYRAVYNNSMMHIRKMRREYPMEEQLAFHLQAQAGNPADAMEYEEIAAMISTTLQELPERTREIFELNRLEGLKYREIAERLSISVKTVEANMGKALKALRTSLKKYEQE
jgi:RNA polymerase sigma-70 factor (ECF subfamily)